jgi:hypothetical protein
MHSPPAYCSQPRELGRRLFASHSRQLDYQRPRAAVCGQGKGRPWPWVARSTRLKGIVEAFVVCLRHTDGLCCSSAGAIWACCSLSSMKLFSRRCGVASEVAVGYLGTGPTSPRMSQSRRDVAEGLGDLGNIARAQCPISQELVQCI